MILLVKIKNIAPLSFTLNIRTRKADDLCRHELAIYVYKLTIHFHIWLLCDVTVRQVFAHAY